MIFYKYGILEDFIGNEEVNFGFIFQSVDYIAMVFTWYDIKYWYLKT